VIVASNGGSPAHPNCYYNLKANPLTTIEAGAETVTVLAQELDGGNLRVPPGQARGTTVRGQPRSAHVEPARLGLGLKNQGKRLQLRPAVRAGAPCRAMTREP
jgi:F420H(2)-dependent quinone reductase